jgi:hypothetical protein
MASAGRAVTQAEYDEFCREFPLAKTSPVKIDRETLWCPSCQRVHTLEEWEDIMSGQEQGEWVWA